MSENWSYVWDVMVICLFLGLATYIRRSFKFFRKFFIPNAIIAGFIGLLLGPQILNLIPFNADHMGTIIYHLMSIGFIALALKDRNTTKNKDIVNTGIIIVNGYVLQGILGFGLSVLMAYTILPDLFPVFGMLLPLGYGQGAGQAYSMGRQWESLGFSNGGNIGLTIAALGLLWACIGGIPLMNYMIKVKKIKPSYSLTNSQEDTVQVEVVKEHVGETESVDGFTIQLFTIGIIYLATYLTLLGLTEVLKNFGTFGNTLSTMLWGFSFIIAALFAILFRFILDVLKKKKVIKREYTSNFLLERISGGAFDIMITASIAAISITILKQYLLPTMVISTLGGIATILYVIFLGKRMYKNDVLENTLGLYGNLTGVVSTGLALVKEIDPKLESSAGRNLVLGSGAGLFVGFPLMLLLNVPVVGYVSNTPILYLWTMIGLAAYFAILSVVLYLRRVK
ncbi:MAG: sodium:glutamate symporter [Clostridiaceae bacterium]|nr:sodium:glutamate symporter [Clostridiaceae bacterium]